MLRISSGRDLRVFRGRVPLIFITKGYLILIIMILISGVIFCNVWFIFKEFIIHYLFLTGFHRILSPKLISPFVVINYYWLCNYWTRFLISRLVNLNECFKLKYYYFIFIFIIIIIVKIQRFYRIVNLSILLLFRIEFN